MEYIEFLKNKMAISHETGFEIKAGDYPHNLEVQRW